MVVSLVAALLVEDNAMGQGCWACRVAVRDSACLQ